MTSSHSSDGPTSRSPLSHDLGGPDTGGGAPYSNPPGGQEDRPAASSDTSLAPAGGGVRALQSLAWVRHANAVRPGYWLVRARTGPRQWGPLVPAAIVVVRTEAEPDEPDNAMDRSPFFAAFVAGQPVSVWSLQQETHTFGERIYRTEQVIGRAEYEYRLADLRWAQEHAPDEPQAQPHKTLDLMQAKLPF